MMIMRGDLKDRGRDRTTKRPVEFHGPSGYRRRLSFCCLSRAYVSSHGPSRDSRSNRNRRRSCAGRRSWSQDRGARRGRQGGVGGWTFGAGLSRPYWCQTRPVAARGQTGDDDSGEATHILSVGRIMDLRAAPAVPERANASTGQPPIPRPASCLGHAAAAARLSRRQQPRRRGSSRSRCAAAWSDGS